MFEFIKNSILNFNKNLENNKNKNDLDNILTKITYNLFHENIEIDEINNVELQINNGFTKKFDYNHSTLFNKMDFNINFLIDDIIIYDIEFNKLDINKNNKYEFDKNYNHKPLNINIIDNDNKIEVQVNEIGVKHIYDIDSNKYINGIVYEKLFKINNKELTLEELKENKPMIYNKIVKDLNITLELIDLQLFYKDKNNCSICDR